MEFDEVVMGRRSIRGFKPDPVPKTLIREIMTLATRAPSSMNTQPWYFHVVTGAPLDRIREGNTERNLAGVPASREIRMHGPYEGVHRIGRKRLRCSSSKRWTSNGADKERRQ